MTERELIFHGAVVILAGCPTLLPYAAVKIARDTLQAVDTSLHTDPPTGVTS